MLKHGATFFMRPLCSWPSSATKPITLTVMKVIIIIDKNLGTDGRLLP